MKTCETDTACQNWEVKYTHSDAENIVSGEYSSVVFAFHASIMFNVKYSQNTQQNFRAKLLQCWIKNTFCHLNLGLLWYMQNNSTWIFNFKVYTAKEVAHYLRTKSPSTFCMSIQFCYNDRTYIHFLFEGSSLSFTSLTNCCIHHKDNIIWSLKQWYTESWAEIHPMLWQYFLARGQCHYLGQSANSWEVLQGKTTILKPKT